MCTRYLLVFLFAAFTLAAGAQQREAVFDKDVPVTWLGVDFSAALLVGDRERLGSEADIAHLLGAWNDIFLDEPEKFNVARAIGRTSVNYAVQVTRERNSKLNALSLYSDGQNSFHLNVNGVKEIVSGYDFKGNSGIGLMFVVERFSKPSLEAAIWVTFVDMSSAQVIFAERLTAAPAGFGMRNYWANSMYDVLKQMQKKEFEMWRKKYYRL